MTIGLSTAALALVFLVALRIGPLFVLAPVFGAATVPVRIRVLLALAMALVLAAALDVPARSMPVSAGGLIVAALGELALGVAFAFGVFAAFGAFLFGGRVLDMQIGYGIASLIDPATRNQAPLVGSALNFLAVAVFFAVDGHHALLRALAWSFQRVPPGGPAGALDLAALDLAAVSAQFGVMFSLGLVLVAPAVFALLLLDVALAVLARTMPQMNIFVVAMPLKIVVGVGVLALSAQQMLPPMLRVFDSIPAYWDRLLG